MRLEQEVMRKELPLLQENLTKTKSKLTAVQKTVRQKAKQINQASSITEIRLAEAISHLSLFWLSFKREMTLMWTLMAM